MSHTLNEQSLLITGNDASERASALITGTAALTGWYYERTSDNIDRFYCDENHTMGAYIKYTSGSSAEVGSFFHNDIRLGYTSSYSLSSDFNIYFHKSSDETIDFLDFNSAYSQMIYTQNIDGDDIIFGPDSSSVTFWGTSTISTKKSWRAPYDNSDLTYCITKMPDFINGKIIPSLYCVISVANPVRRNQLISFNGEIYRIVFLASNSIGINYQAFAFPVADEVT